MDLNHTRLPIPPPEQFSLAKHKIKHRFLVLVSFNIYPLFINFKSLVLIFSHFFLFCLHNQPPNDTLNTVNP